MLRISLRLIQGMLKLFLISAKALLIRLELVLDNIVKLSTYINFVKKKLKLPFSFFVYSLFSNNEKIL